MSDFDEMVRRLVDEAVRPLREEIAQLRAANIDPESLSPREAGQRWFGGVTAATVIGWIRAGHLQGAEAPGGKYLVTRAAKDEFFLRRRVRAVARDQEERPSAREWALKAAQKG